MIEVRALPAFTDNYFWLLRHRGRSVVVDPGDAGPVIAQLSVDQDELHAILLTHHHHDHIGGVAALAQRWPELSILGPDDARIPARQRVAPGMSLRLFADWPELRIIDLGGHTRSHIGYLIDGKLFCGDALFSLGCGRLFEGSAEQMWESLQRIAALPPDTQIFAAHEYTAANLRFAHYLTPDDPALAAFAEQLHQWRRNNQASLPTSLARELALNPFLRVADPGWRAGLVRHPALASLDQHASAAATFAALRRLKDDFR